jgi:hypothetical protein
MSTMNVDRAPPNAFFAAQEGQRLALLDIAERLGAAVEEQRTNPIAPALRDIDQRLGKIDATMAQIEQTIRGLDQTIGQFDRDTVDYVTALYAAAVDTTGVIVQNTNAGEWLAEAWKNCRQKTAPTICEIATLANKPSIARQFIAELIGSKNRFAGIAANMSEPDIRRFLSLAQGVCDAISSAPPPPPPPPPAATS